MIDRTLQMPTGAVRDAVAGPAERHLKLLREALGVRVSARGDDLFLRGDAQVVARAVDVLDFWRRTAERTGKLSHAEVLESLAEATSRPWDTTGATTSSDDPPTPSRVLHRSGSRARSNGDTTQGDAATGDPTDASSRAFDLDIAERHGFDVYLQGRNIRAQTEGQRAYVRALLRHDLTFCTGPAGTGKTYLAVAAAVAQLKRSHVRRIVLCRPAVEAGEKIGFLPGTLQDKVNPYLRPLLDSLNDMMDPDTIRRLTETEVIEILPLAFMRGRTLNDAFIILDEAQNTTRQQMLMFLTRMGRQSRMVVTGDTAQTDLPDPSQSGLNDAIQRLNQTQGVAITTLERSDVVRHELVQRVIEAYGAE